MTKDTENKFAQWTMAKPDSDAGERVLAKAFAELGLSEPPFTLPEVVNRRDHQVTEKQIQQPWYAKLKLLFAFDRPAWCFSLCVVLLWCNFILDDVMVSTITSDKPTLSEQKNYEAQILEQELAELNKWKPEWIKSTMAQ